MRTLILAMACVLSVVQVSCDDDDAGETRSPADVTGANPDGSAPGGGTAGDDQPPSQSEWLRVVKDPYEPDIASATECSMPRRITIESDGSYVARRSITPCTVSGTILSSELNTLSNRVEAVLDSLTTNRTCEEIGLQPGDTGRIAITAANGSTSTVWEEIPGGGDRCFRGQRADVDSLNEHLTTLFQKYAI